MPKEKYLKRLKNIEKKINDDTKDFSRYKPIVLMDKPFYIDGRRMPPPIIGELSKGGIPL